MRILVVENNLVLAHAAERILSLELDAEVVVLPNGRDALDRMAGGDFDLLMTAWNLPDTNGLEVMTRIRQVHEDVPIILCSDKSYHEALLAAVEAGASDYLLKPFEREVLLAKVRKALRKTALYRNRRIA